MQLPYKVYTCFVFGIMKRSISAFHGTYATCKQANHRIAQHLNTLSICCNTFVIIKVKDATRALWFVWKAFVMLIEGVYYYYCYALYVCICLNGSIMLITMYVKYF